jgi:RNA-directed DNA polymerase
MRKHVNYVIEADIKGYSDNVSHDRMMKFPQVRINDSSFLLLIHRFLKAEYFEAGKVVLTEQGTPQGGNLR